MKAFVGRESCYLFSDIDSTLHMIMAIEKLLLRHLVLIVATAFLLLAFVPDGHAASYKKSSGKDIGSFMEKLHKGKTSYATYAKAGKLNSSQLTALARQYRLMLNLTPAKNKQLWKKSVSGLVLATQSLARSPKDKGRLAAYSKACDCNACHKRHR